MKHLNFIGNIIFFTVLIMACTKIQEDKSPDARISSKIGIEWSLDSVEMDSTNWISNVTLTIYNNRTDTFKDQGWTVYYNQLIGPPETLNKPGQLEFENITGDYHKFYPLESFEPIPPGSSKNFSIIYRGIPLRTSYRPVGMYIVDEGQVENIDDLEINGINDEMLSVLDPPSPESRYQDNENLSPVDYQNLPKVIPRPVTYQIQPEGKLNLVENITIAHPEELTIEANYLKGFLHDHFSITSDLNSGGTGHIVLAIRSSGQQEGYGLTINNTQARITGNDRAGAFYGIQSILQLIEPEFFQTANRRISLPAIQIEDHPRYGYRGLQLDVSRNFHSKEQVKKIMDLMASYKLNKLHFTITNDEGWRLEIPGLPELTDVGAFRGHTVDESEHLYPAYGSGPFRDADISYGSGYYTREDYIDLLKYAKERYIEVIPEIDLPGHERAAIIAMRARYRKYIAEGDTVAAEEYLLHDPNDQSVYRSAQNYNDNVICVCRESAFRFTEKVIDEVVKMHREAGNELKILHSGGDEVPYGAWQKSPICQQFIQQNQEINDTDHLHAYFLRRFNSIMSQYGIQTAGWEEIVLKSDPQGHHTTAINHDFVGSGLIPYVWNSVWGWGREDMAYKLANLGFEIVMCNSGNLYLDMAYNAHPDEHGLSWSGFIDTKTVFSFAPENMFQVTEIASTDNILDEDYLADKVRLTEEGQKNIMGIQAELWSETLRSEDLMEYMLFPKLLGFSERAWSMSPDWVSISNKEGQVEAFNRDWNEFANMLGQRELHRLDLIFGGVNYRIPPPGAKYENRLFEANVMYPGMTIRYTVDGSEPDTSSSIYSEPVRILTQEVKLKTFNSRGRSSRLVKLIRNQTK